MVADVVWSDIPGWFSEEEAALYLQYLDGPWCEVGSWRGRSAYVLASSGYPGTCIEWFQGSPEHNKERDPPEVVEEDLRSNLAGFNVRIIDKDFHEAADDVGEVQFLHLDADHSYNMTQAAFDLYSPKIVTDGFFALHDAWGESGSHERTAWPGSMKFAKELIRNPAWMHIQDAHRAAIFQKR